MPYKAGKLYSAIAKQDGVVTSKTDTTITVTYKDGTTDTTKIGRQYGRMEGGLYPHSLVTDLTLNSKVKANQYIAYNEGFFEKDWLDSSKLVMKMGRNVTVALALTNEVFEDSSAICKSLSEEMSTYVIKERIFRFEFDKNVFNLVPEGSTVEANTILFNVMSGETDYNNLSETSIAMLQNLSSLSPKSKYSGIIDKYEIKYNGELTDMSPSLRKLATRLDKELLENTRGTDEEYSNNRVNSEYRSDGKNLQVDTVELKVLIRVKLKQSNGDKGVFANQMKSIISDVYEYDLSTESGTKVEAIFSYTSIINRIVASPIIIGTTSRLLKHVSKKVADVYFN